MVVCLILGLVLVLYEGLCAYLCAQSRSWPTTSGEVVSSWVARTSARRSRRRRAYIRYKYDVDGKTYRSSSLFYGQYTSFKVMFMPTQLVDEYDEGTRVTVHYNPDSPTQCVLNTDYPTSSLVMLVLGFGLAAGGGAMLWQHDFSPAARDQLSDHPDMLPGGVVQSSGNHPTGGTEFK